MALELSIEEISAGRWKGCSQSVVARVREFVESIPGKPAYLIDEAAVMDFVNSAFVMSPPGQSPAVGTISKTGQVTLWKPTKDGQRSRFVETSPEIIKPALKGTDMMPSRFHFLVDRLIWNQIIRFKQMPVQLATGIDWQVQASQRAVTVVSIDPRSFDSGSGNRDLVARFPAVRPVASATDPETRAKVWKDFQRFCPAAQPLLDLMLYTRAAGSYCVMQQMYSKNPQHRASSRADVTLLDSEAHRFLIQAIEQAGVAFELTKTAYKAITEKLTSVKKNQYLRSWVTIDPYNLASDTLFGAQTYRPAELVLRWGVHPTKPRPDSIVISSPKLWLSQSRLIKAGMAREDYIEALGAYIGAFLIEGADEIRKEAGVWSDVAKHYADNAEWFARTMDKFVIPKQDVDFRVERHTYQAWIEAMSTQAQAGRHRAIKALPGLSSSPEKLRLMRQVKPPANCPVVPWAPEQVALVCRLAMQTRDNPQAAIRSSYSDYDVFANTRLPNGFETFHPNPQNDSQFIEFADALELVDSSLLPEWAVQIEHDSEWQPVAIRIHELCLASLLKCGELMAMELSQHELRVAEIERHRRKSQSKKRRNEGELAT